MPDTSRHLTSCCCFGGAWALRGPRAALILSAQEGSSGAQPHTPKSALKLDPRCRRSTMSTQNPTTSRRCHRQLRQLAWMCFCLEYQPRRGPDGSLCSNLAASHDNLENILVHLRLSAHICCFFCEPALGFLRRMCHAKHMFDKYPLVHSCLCFSFGCQVLRTNIAQPWTDMLA